MLTLSMSWYIISGGHNQMKTINQAKPNKNFNFVQFRNYLVFIFGMGKRGLFKGLIILVQNENI